VIGCFIGCSNSRIGCFIGCSNTVVGCLIGCSNTVIGCFISCCITVIGCLIGCSNTVVGCFIGCSNSMHVDRRKAFSLATCFKQLGCGPINGVSKPLNSPHTALISNKKILTHELKKVFLVIIIIIIIEHINV